VNTPKEKDELSRTWSHVIRIIRSGEAGTIPHQGPSQQGREQVS
jgi:hypothetical protein